LFSVLLFRKPDSTSAHRAPVNTPVRKIRIILPR
jgi:hypothetical protein